MITKPKIYIITGEQGEGKTSFLVDLIEKLKSENIKLSGFYNRGFWKEDQRSGFDLIDIQTKQVYPFCNVEKRKGWLKIQKYFFNPETIEFGRKIIARDNRNINFLVIDEIGLLDIKGELWGPVIDQLIHRYETPMIWVIRKAFINEVVRHWAIENHDVFDIQLNTLTEIIKKLLKDLND